jgi:hypothetical protein
MQTQETVGGGINPHILVICYEQCKQNVGFREDELGVKCLDWVTLPILLGGLIETPRKAR